MDILYHTWLHRVHLPMIGQRTHNLNLHVVNYKPDLFNEFTSCKLQAWFFLHEFPCCKLQAWVLKMNFHVVDYKPYFLNIVRICITLLLTIIDNMICLAQCWLMFFFSFSTYQYYSYKDSADLKRGISPPCFYGDVNNKR